MNDGWKDAKRDWEETKRLWVEIRNTLAKFTLINLPWMIGAYTISEWIVLYFQGS